MRAACVLPSEPSERLIDLIARPVLTEQHAAVRAQNANVEALTAHGGELSAYCVACDYGSH
jgi:hypothetical protein